MGLTGCVATGDWNEDSLFFSRPLAEQRLGVMQAELNDIQAQTVRLSSQTALIKSRLNQAKSENTTNHQRLSLLQKQVTEMEQESSRLNHELRGLNITRDEQLQRRRQLENQIMILEGEILQLRAELLLLLQHR